MQIKTVRASGMPVKNEHIEAFSNEFRAAYDKAIIKVIGDMNTAPNQEQSERLNKLLARCESSLKTKYPVEEKWDLVTSAEDWKELVDQYGIIMIAKEEKELIYVIYDLEL